MVCPRCVNSVRNILLELKLTYNKIELGKVELAEIPITNQQKLLSQKLEELGFELLDTKEGKLINAIKTYLVEHIHYGKHQSKQNISDALSQHLNREYSALSKTFSKVEGITIEKYIVYQKVERIKELLSYDERSITEIAYKLNYSSSAHLSSQFKKVTGMSPSQFKKMSSKNRNSLDSI